MARHEPIFDFPQAHLFAAHVRNGAAGICTPSARPPTLADLAQAGDQLGTQLTAQHGVKRGVGGLVAGLERLVVRLHRRSMCATVTAHADCTMVGRLRATVD